MPPKKKRSKATKSPPEVWVSPDLMRKLKGADEHRAGPMPHSPYLALADRFLGVLPSESSASKSTARTSAGHGAHHAAHKSKEAAPSPEPPRAMAAATAAGAGPEAVLSSVPPRILYPKPPVRPAPPKPPKLTRSGPPARPNPPQLHPPKPPKMSFGYRRRKVDRAK